jgi:hypothetical protein
MAKEVRVGIDTNGKRMASEVKIGIDINEKTNQLTEDRNKF